MTDTSFQPQAWFNHQISLTKPLTPKKLYDFCYLHPLLVDHLWRVTSLAAKLLENWTGPKLSHQILLECMLLHDLGNLVKFDLSSSAPSYLMSQVELPFYRELQKTWRDKFGQDADVASSLIIADLPLKNSAVITQLITGHAAGTLTSTVESHNWLQKLCDYTDFRIGPFGLVTLTERFSDLKNRYAYQHADWVDEANVNFRLATFQKLESQLQAMTSCDITKLITADLGRIGRWQDFEFETN